MRHTDQLMNLRSVKSSGSFSSSACVMASSLPVGKTSTLRTNTQSDIVSKLICHVQGLEVTSLCGTIVVGEPSLRTWIVLNLPFWHLCL